MERVVDLPDVRTELMAITRAEVQKYAAFSHTSKLYSVLDDEQKIYAVITVPHLPRPWPSRVVIMAQVVDDKVVVIEDVSDKPLVDALMVNAGVPREKIVLAYRGEKP